MDKLAGTVTVVIITFTLAILGVAIFSQTQTSSVAGCTVIDKDRASNSDGGSSMRVYTENCGVFNIEDSLLDSRFDSADAYSKIQADTTYDFETRGIRLPLLSMFPNIVSFVEVS
jgi:hypothetical protein